MTKITTKRILFSAIIILMGFGIGSVAHAATKTTTTSAPANLQPASGQTEYHAMDGTTPAGTAVDSTGTSKEGTGTAETKDTGIVGMFGLNWKLFLAQLINFGIILFVLWKWVFGPVTKGLSDRTEKIESSLADAQKIAEDRETFDSWKQGEISQVRTEASAIITQAKRDAETLKAETLEQTKTDQEKLITQAQTKLEQEKQQMLESVKGELASLIVSATESVLRHKLDPKKDSALIDQALQEASNSHKEGIGA